MSLPTSQHVQHVLVFSLQANALKNWQRTAWGMAQPETQQLQFPRKHTYPYYQHQTGNNACESRQYSTSTLSRRQTKYYNNGLNEQNELTKYWVASDHSWFVMLLLVWPSCALPDSQTLWVWACDLTAVAGQQGHWVVGSVPVSTPAKYKHDIQVQVL
jgi:hypothetical protein